MGSRRPTLKAHRQPEPETALSDAGSASSGNESDYLDNAASRKRRRTSPDQEDVSDDEDDDDEDDDKNPEDDENEDDKDASDDDSDDDDDDDLQAKPVISFIQAPSRVRPVGARKTNDATPSVQPAANPILAPTDSNTDFHALNVRPWLVQSLANMAIKRPTGIQKGCIPEILKGRDCIGGSRTGSGKTVAFAVPVLQKWAEDPTAIFGVVLRCV